MSTQTSDFDFSGEGSSTLAAGRETDFVRTWNACSSYQEALSVLHSDMGLSVREIRLAAKVLYRTGAISPLPVKDGSVDLTEDDVLRFSLVWNKAETSVRVAHVLCLPLDIVTQRARTLRDAGVMLQPLKDFDFGMGNINRPEVWDVSVDRVNDLLNGEIVVRSALLKQDSLRKKAAGMVTSIVRLKAGGERTTEQEVFISLAESFLRELGVF